MLLNEDRISITGKYEIICTLPTVVPHKYILTCHMNMNINYTVHSLTKITAKCYNLGLLIWYISSEEIYCCSLCGVFQIYLLTN